MKLFPFNRFRLKTNTSAEQVAAALQAHVGQSQRLEISLGPFDRKPDYQYTGDVSREGFKISPAIRYRNSFKPTIVGAVEPWLSGSRVKVTQRLNSFVIGFLIIWVSMTLMFAGTLLFAVGFPEDDAPMQFARFAPLLMLAFVWALASGGFWWEARHTKNKLISILDARVDDGF